MTVDLISSEILDEDQSVLFDGQKANFSQLTTLNLHSFEPFVPLLLCEAYMDPFVIVCQILPSPFPSRK